MQFDDMNEYQQWLITYLAERVSVDQVAALRERDDIRDTCKFLFEIVGTEHQNQAQVTLLKAESRGLSIIDAILTLRDAIAEHKSDTAMVFH